MAKTDNLFANTMPADDTSPSNNQLKLQTLPSQKVSEAFIAKTPGEKRLKKLLQEIEYYEQEGKDLETFLQQNYQRAQAEIMPIYQECRVVVQKIIRYAFEFSTTRKHKKSTQKLAVRVTLEMLNLPEFDVSNVLTEEEVELLISLEKKHKSKRELQEEKDLQEMDDVFSELFGLDEEGFGDDTAEAKNADEAWAAFETEMGGKKQHQKENNRHSTGASQGAQKKPMASAELAAKSLYRDLAKEHHPDLHIDDTTKTEKTELMQKITTAYRENDFLSLLKFKGKLSEIDPSIIKQIEPLLKKNRDALRAKFSALRNQNPDLIAKFYKVSAKQSEKLWAMERRAIEKQLSEFKDMLQTLSGSDQGFLYWARQILSYSADQADPFAEIFY